MSITKPFDIDMQSCGNVVLCERVTKSQHKRVCILRRFFLRKHFNSFTIDLSMLWHPQAEPAFGSMFVTSQQPEGFLCRNHRMKLIRMQKPSLNHRILSRSLALTVGWLAFNFWKERNSVTKLPEFGQPVIEEVIAFFDYHFCVCRSEEAGECVHAYVRVTCECVLW